MSAEQEVSHCANGGVPHLEALVASLQPVVATPIRAGISAASVTTFAVGGPIDALISVQSVTELTALRRAIAATGRDARILGNGSNVLVSDRGLSSLVVTLTGDLRSVSAVGDGIFDVGAGASLMSLSRKLSQEGYSGLEFSAGIPATMGGALFMNAGAHGAEIGERVVYVDGVTREGKERRVLASELPWRYRSSGLPADFFVTGARLKLSAGDKALISAQCAHNLEERRRRQPLSLPSAGSVFKNPSPELSAGRLLEEAGLKGHVVGGAMISPLHANWIVNPNRLATAEDVCALIALCQARVQERSGIELHPEVRIWS